MLFTILIVILALMLFGGFRDWGGGPGYGYGHGMNGVLGLILVIVVVLVLLGRVH